MQISLNIVYKISIFIGLSILLQPGLKLTAQAQVNGPDDGILKTRFIKPEIAQKAGDLSFNIIRIINQADTAVRIKPIAIFPDDWAIFSMPYNDTLVLPHDSVSLIYRFQLPSRLSSDLKHEILFRAYSTQNKLLSACSFFVDPEVVRNIDVNFPEKRVFFYPRKKMADFNVLVENKGNIAEQINLQVGTDNKTELTTPGDWKTGQILSLAPFQDTLIKFSTRYINEDNRVFDISKLNIQATATDIMVDKPLLIEKYSDIYSPLAIDPALPHQVEMGFRTFSGNSSVLPYIKARGTSRFKNQSLLLYNLNYYALTGNEDLISNTYYTFLYSWQSLKVGFGAFSSPLGRNLYTRNGVMASNVIKLGPNFSLEPFISQSILIPKTSVAVGYSFLKKKLGFHGSIAYDLDNESKIKTGSFMLQSTMIPIFKKQGINANLYAYHEYHYLNNAYTLSGIAWDINYFVNIGQAIKLQLTNNYGSPDIPGPQMGLLNFSANAIYLLGNPKKHISIQYINISRDYYTYNNEGIKLPNTSLYDQYANILFHSSKNPNHIWQAGPSIESYHSFRPSNTLPGERVEYSTQKLRVEYKSSIAKNLTINLKTGMTYVSINESKPSNESKYDFHLAGGFSIFRGAGISFSYDYGPLVNNGLYQYAGDSRNNSITFGPSMMGAYFKNRLIFNLFSNFTYRFDLQYGAININPKIDTYLFRDWYLGVSGTYHYTRQQFPDYLGQNSYVYLECSLKKKFGKSDLNKWQKNTRQLKVILFKDDNSNGVKDVFEQGVPYVKTRVLLTNTDDPNIGKQFPVDITLLSNEKGQVTFNRLPTGFYELSINPLGDVKEYFYVDRSIEKLELTRNRVYYVPFQKATKITGKLNVERQKFVKTGEEKLDLENIKVTAYNKQGNSYSSFTMKDGSFTLFVPGNNAYSIRMGNVFGSGFKILQNDISVVVADTTTNRVEFNIVEIGRQVKFKEAKPAKVDTVQQVPLKIKVLHGKFYENSSEEPVDKNAVPEFNNKEAPVQEQGIIPGNYYVVIEKNSSRTEAVKLLRIVNENGVNASLGYNETDGMYYVFTKYYPNKGDTRQELELLNNAGLKEAEAIKF